MPVTVTGLKEVSRAFSRFSVTKAFVSFADGAGPRITAGLRDYAPVGPTREDGTKPHKHLRDSIRWVRHTGSGHMQLMFTSDVPQARYVISGTRAHTIPKDGRRSLLSWVADEGRVFVIGPVNHPGTRPNPFPAHYWQANRRSIGAEFRRAIGRTMRQARGGV